MTAPAAMRLKIVVAALTEHRGYLASTRRNHPSYTGKAGQKHHAQHEAKMALLVELLEAEVDRLNASRCDHQGCDDEITVYGDGQWCDAHASSRTDDVCWNCGTNNTLFGYGCCQATVMY